MERFKQDAVADLYGLERRIIAAERSLENTTKRSTADIEIAKLPSLKRQADALRAEIARLPERPPRSYCDMGGTHKWLERDCGRDPLSPAEIEQLEIPAFLRRGEGTCIIPCKS